MNIHEIKCKISKQAISGTSHDNLVRFSAISSFYQCLFQFYKLKTLGYDLLRVSFTSQIEEENKTNIEANIICDLSLFPGV